LPFLNIITTIIIIANEITMVMTLVIDSISSGFVFGNGFNRLGGA
jgi:hypothetical protein